VGVETFAMVMEGNLREIPAETIQAALDASGYAPRMPGRPSTSTGTRRDGREARPPHRAGGGRQPVGRQVRERDGR